MKKLIICCGICLFATSASAALTGNEVKRLGDAATVLTDLRDAPDSGIPEDLWSKAQCVLVIPSMKKAAFVFGGEAGSGVMSCRRATGWSAPVFMHLAKGSFGLQIGAEQVDLVLLVMNRQGADKLLQDKVSLGADVVAGGGTGRPIGHRGDRRADERADAVVFPISGAVRGNRSVRRRAAA